MGRLVSLGHSARNTWKLYAMYDHKKDNPIPTYAGKGPDLSSQMDWMLKEIPKVREEMKARQEETVLKFQV